MFLSITGPFYSHCSGLCCCFYLVLLQYLFESLLWSPSDSFYSLCLVLWSMLFAHIIVFCPFSVVYPCSGTCSGTCPYSGICPCSGICPSSIICPCSILVLLLVFHDSVSFLAQGQNVISSPQKYGTHNILDTYLGLHFCFSLPGTRLSLSDK